MSLIYYLLFFGLIATMKKVMPTKVVKMPINNGHSEVIDPCGLAVSASESTVFKAGLK